MSALNVNIANFVLLRTKLELLNEGGMAYTKKPNLVKRQLKFASPPVNTKCLVIFH